MKTSYQRYIWRGKASSSSQMQVGYIWAEQEQDAFQQLLSQQIMIHDIRPAPQSRWVQSRQQITPKEVTHFFQQIATLLRAGFSMLQALSLIAQQPLASGYQHFIQHLKHKMLAGTPIGEAFKQSPCSLPPLYIALINAGESTGQLAQTFDYLHQLREKEHQLKAKIFKASLYPVLVLLGIVGVMMLMIYFVIPQFEAIFRSFHAELPWATRQLLSCAHLVQQTSHRLLFYFGLVTLSIMLFKRYSPHNLEQVYRYLPIIGSLKYLGTILRLCHVFNTSYQCQLPITICLENAQLTAQSHRLSRALKEVKVQVEQGIPLSQAMAVVGEFPSLMIQMIQVGEESGTLSNMLDQVIYTYEQKINQRIDTLGQLLEPLTIFLLGGGVGVIIITMYLPIFNLMQVMG